MYKSFLKRTIEILISFTGFLFLMPIYIFVYLLVRVKLGSPVFFYQSRPGLNGKIFNIYKFRTMILNRYEDSVFADNNDKRLTKFGKFLRITALDEMPQFLNVLFGNMSVVGPRPHPIKLNEEYKNTVEKFSKRHQFKPGITGLAQISGYRGKINEFYDMSSRVKLDRYYFKNWSILLDFKICFKTILGLLRINTSLNTN